MSAYVANEEDEERCYLLPQKMLSSSIAHINKKKKKKVQTLGQTDNIKNVANIKMPDALNVDDAANEGNSNETNLKEEEDQNAWS